MSNLAQLNLQRWIDAREGKLERTLSASQKAVRHKCFVSYHQEDEVEVRKFLEEFEVAFIPRVLGASDEDDFIDSDDTDYVMDQIRERYLTDSTVTISLIGKCTWARKYVDWEVYSTLRNDKFNRLSGLMAVTLPSIENSTKTLPDRVSDNVNGTGGYARWWKYPSSVGGLQSMIEEAFQARTSRVDLIDNSRARRMRNSSCLIV
ncbi:TIR domain-containing protein [Streptomyces sp. NBC_00564]|uniref:TIR domain-containing protein n=1 Tax=Streptomyces sp. NBC_00564 TaxID=2903663 RepID=UPI00352D5F2D|nr:TIR domain-containing protein [Streptomyces sp. NBC_00564]